MQQERELGLERFIHHLLMAIKTTALLLSVQISLGWM